MSEHRSAIRPRNLAAFGSLFAFLVVAFTSSSLSQSVTLGWDDSPSPGVTNYVLYGSTNTFDYYARSNSLMRVNTGTNLTVTVFPTKPMRLFFTVTAMEDGLESTNSNIVAVNVPAPPSNLLTVVLQYGATLSSVTNDALFLKLRIP